MFSKKEGTIAIIIIAILVVLGFAFFNSSNDSSNDLVETEKMPAANWINLELKNVLTGKTFKISDFNDKPVLLESFAVWCPTCTKQQRVIKDLHEEIGDSVVSVSIDTDPNEDESRVLKHINDNGFDWNYAVSPTEFTRSLIDQFGIGIVNAPSAPMVLICENGNARKLGSGVKSVETLKNEISKGC